MIVALVYAAADAICVAFWTTVPRPELVASLLVVVLIGAALRGSKKEEDRCE